MSIMCTLLIIASFVMFPKFINLKLMKGATDIFSQKELSADIFNSGICYRCHLLVALVLRVSQLTTWGERGEALAGSGSMLH